MAFKRAFQPNQTQTHTDTDKRERGRHTHIHTHRERGSIRGKRSRSRERSRNEAGLGRHDESNVLLTLFCPSSFLPLWFLIPGPVPLAVHLPVSDLFRTSCRPTAQRADEPAETKGRLEEKRREKVEKGVEIKGEQSREEKRRAKPIEK